MRVRALPWSGGARERRGGGGGGERVAVDEQGDVAVGQDRGAGEGSERGDVGRQWAGDELVLTDELGDGEGDAAVVAVDDDRELAVLVTGMPERGGRVVQRHDRVADDQHA